jgi:G6PDH family F420-dependent oxidoreductase
MKIGYFLSSEEWGPRDLVAQAIKANEAGFEGLWISDHYHPWNDQQGHGSFVWTVIGALAAAVPGVHVTTAVTCPTMRIHPTVIGQAAATAAVLLDGEFALGVGSGEALNEHIFGDAWPAADERLEMLEESIEVIRTLWQGGEGTLVQGGTKVCWGDDELYVNQIGPDQDAFFEAYSRHVLPALR